MAVEESRIIDGVVRATWDDDLEQYREFAADGITATLTRAYTTVELLIKADRAARVAAGDNSSALRSQAQAAITQLLADRTAVAGLGGTANATVNANPAVYVKGVANALDRTDKYLIQVIRLVAGLLDTTDSGA